MRSMAEKRAVARPPVVGSPADSTGSRTGVSSDGFNPIILPKGTGHASGGTYLCPCARNPEEPVDGQGSHGRKLRSARAQVKTAIPSAASLRERSAASRHGSLPLPASSGNTDSPAMPYAMRSAGWLCLGACFVLGLAAVAVGLYTAPEWMPWALSIRDNLEVWLAQTPPLWFILAMAVLPLVPVPISLFYLAAGAYGAASGIAIVLIGLAVNMSLAYGLSASLLRPLISRWIQKTGRQLPAASGRRQQLTLLLLVRLFPGFPYFLQNYLLRSEERRVGKEC